MPDLHPVVSRAAAGELPPWARAGEGRRAHMDRVVELMDGWARDLGLAARDVGRWRAVGYLHDALRDAPPEALRSRVPEDLRDLPGEVLHGPAASERLRKEGVRDEALLRAVAFHTLGHPELGTLGRALFAADFLDPGRDLRNEWRAGLRSRMPRELDPVVLEIAECRVAHARRAHGGVRPESTAFLERLRDELDQSPGDA